METAPSSPPPMANPTPGHKAVRPANSLEENTITNICASNIILDVPEMTTRSRTGTEKATAPAVAVPSVQTITKIIIPKHVLQAGGQLVTVLPGGVRALQPTLLLSGASRQPPPLQQMQIAPPPPRLQQMAPAPPPLQAKPREGSAMPGLPVSITATPPPPLQIKIVPAAMLGKDSLPIIVSDTVAVTSSTTASVQSAPVVSVQVVNSVDTRENADSDDITTEVLPSEEVNIRLNLLLMLVLCQARPVIIHKYLSDLTVEGFAKVTYIL